jgi:hypothetical protein
MPQTIEKRRSNYAANPEKHREQSRRWRANNREKSRELRRQAYKRNPEMYRLVSRRWLANLRQEMLTSYGRSCACCGESIEAFLTLDHINGGGHKERKEFGANTVLFKLKQAGWPKDGYRILCMNCNFATRFGRPCPHSTPVAAETFKVACHTGGI